MTTLLSKATQQEVKSGEKVKYFNQFGKSNLSLIDFDLTFQVNPRGFLEGFKQKKMFLKKVMISKRKGAFVWRGPTGRTRPSF
jgi:hypothetical protein